MSKGFLLDTNVLSELMGPTPHASVWRWFSQHRQIVMWTSAVNQAEILSGIALLPVGKRRTALDVAAQQMFERDFQGRVCAFDSAAARHYAHLIAGRTRRGRPMSTEDGQIAAIALAEGLVLVTRNTKDFDHIAGLRLQNPWENAS